MWSSRGHKQYSDPSHHHNAEIGATFFFLFLLMFSTIFSVKGLITWD